MWMVSVYKPAKWSAIFETGAVPLYSMRKQISDGYRLCKVFSLWCRILLYGVSFCETSFMRCGSHWVEKHQDLKPHIHGQVFLSRIDLKRVLWCVGLNYEDLLELGWETLHVLQFSMDKLNLGKYCSSWGFSESLQGIITSYSLAVEHSSYDFSISLKFFLQISLLSVGMLIRMKVQMYASIAGLLPQTTNVFRAMELLKRKTTGIPNLYIPTFWVNRSGLVVQLLFDCK